jgi:hypothetical protein
VADPGPLEQERVVATYRLRNYTLGGVSAQAGTYVDLAFPDGYRPVEASDTFDRRTRVVTDAVIRIAAIFATTTTRVAGARRLAGRTTDGPRAEWTPAWASPRPWSTAELGALDRSDIGVGVVVDADQLTLLVTTDDGVHERVIPAASALNPHLSRGIAAEAATQNAAATWGLPDFVILPRAEHRGSRNREISDGLLVTGERRVVLQIKSRAAAGDRPDRETSWVDKKVAEAVKQVNGTVRRLRAAPSEMINGRGRTVAVGGSSTCWIGVVIIDHPAPPPDHPLTKPTSGVPVVTLLRRDWEFLFDQLRSTRAVVDYLYRVEGSTALLGGEPERYFELAAADAAAAPGPIDTSLIGERVSTPLLPTAPAGHDDDQAHGLVRLVCEDIANTPSDYDTAALIDVLSTIDTLPVGHRTELGRLLLSTLHSAAGTAPDGVSWRFGIINRGLKMPLLGFGVCSRFDATIRAAFQAWVLLRHHERAPAGQLDRLDQALTVGVLLTPRTDGVRDWDTAMIAVRGDPQLTEEDLTSSRALWNRSAESG